MALIGTRRYSQAELADIFRLLDSGGTRPELRERIRELQGRGVSNDQISRIRDVHRQLRRSQGYRVEVGGKRNLIDPETGQLRRLMDLRPRDVLNPRIRPRPPRLEGVQFRVTSAQTAADGVTTVHVVTVTEDVSLPEAIEEDMRNNNFGSPKGPGDVPTLGPGRRPVVLRVESPI